MAIYDFSNFERQGNIENDVKLNTTDEIIESIIQQTNNSLRAIRIFSPDLESHIYNNSEFRKALLDFSRGNHHAKIEILVEDITTALHEGHQLINLAQQASSIIKIKDIPTDYHGMAISFILFDQTRFTFKPDRKNNYAIFSNCKNRANKLFEFFTSVWDQAEQNSHTRRLNI